MQEILKIGHPLIWYLTELFLFSWADDNSNFDLQHRTLQHLNIFQVVVVDNLFK